MTSASMFTASMFTRRLGRFATFIGGSLVALLTAGVIDVGSQQRADADIIAGWTIPVPFPIGTGTIPTGSTYLPPYITTNSGTTFQFPASPATPYTAGTPDLGALANNTSAILTVFHSNTAAQYTSPAGNGSQYSFSSTFWTAVNDYYEAKVSTTGYSGISLSWDQTRSSTGPAPFKLTMSVNSGTSFTDVVSSYTVLQSGGGGPGTWTTGSYNSLYTFSTGTMTLTSPTVLDAAANQASVIFRFVATGTGSSSNGTNRIDNVTVNGTLVPEPGTCGLAVIAGIGVTAYFRTRGNRRRRSAAVVAD
jgi:hypothetical protein